MFNKRREDGFLVIMLFLPASFEDELGVTEFARYKRPPIKERIERTLIEARNLINQYSLFIRKKLEKFNALEKIEIEPIFFSLPANLFIHLGPYLPESILTRIQKLTDIFCDSLGKRYFEIYHRGKEFFNKERFLESIKKGEIIQAIELRIPEKYFAHVSKDRCVKE